MSTPMCKYSPVARAAIVTLVGTSVPIFYNLLCRGWRQMFCDETPEETAKNQIVLDRQTIGMETFILGVGLTATAFKIIGVINSD